MSKLKHHKAHWIGWQVYAKCSYEYKGAYKITNEWSKVTCKKCLAKRKESQ